MPPSAMIVNFTATSDAGMTALTRESCLRAFRRLHSSRQSQRGLRCATRLRSGRTTAAYIPHFGAELDVKEFYDLFWRRLGEPKIKIPKATEAAFPQLRRMPNGRCGKRSSPWVRRMR